MKGRQGKRMKKKDREKLFAKSLAKDAAQFNQYHKDVADGIIHLIYPKKRKK